MGMLYKLANWWLKLSYKMKIATILLLLAVCVSLYYSAKYSLLKYRYLKEKEKQVEILQDSLKIYKNRVKILTASGINENKQSQIRIRKIDKKLKEDEKAINNATITTNELLNFLTNYEERAKKLQNK